MWACGVCDFQNCENMAWFMYIHRHMQTQFISKVKSRKNIWTLCVT